MKQVSDFEEFVEIVGELSLREVCARLVTMTVQFVSYATNYNVHRLKSLTTFRVCECQSAEREFSFVAVFGHAKVHDFASFRKPRRWLAAVGIEHKQRLLISPRCGARC